jgi:hypothetical protein
MSKASSRKRKRAIDTARQLGYLESDQSIDSVLLSQWEDDCGARRQPVIVVQTYESGLTVVMVQVIHTQMVREVRRVRTLIERVIKDYPEATLNEEEKQALVIGPLPIGRARGFARALVAAQKADNVAE